ncbi:hypothetical protein SAY87_015318 [Trapa incisa]|uniref:Uncharacterized protein n=1 Tax=Trapa incisa TaxID=236973 RepID=A0AAN7JLA8_9MYRT|nr:hypothetical protein SAY87_015318 [Trapa incisa]
MRKVAFSHGNSALLRIIKESQKSFKRIIEISLPRTDCSLITRGAEKAVMQKIKKLQSLIAFHFIVGKLQHGHVMQNISCQISQTILEYADKFHWGQASFVFLPFPTSRVPAYRSL